MADITGAGLADLDFAQVSPTEFAQIVKKLSTKEIKDLANDSELRQRVMSAVYGRFEQQFRPEAAGDLSALIRWKVTGDPEMVFEITIDKGSCTVHEGRSDAEPRLTLIMDDVTALKLVSGNANPVTLFMTRKLKVAGDVGLATGLTRYFDIPKA